ncbi:MAG TPA: N-acetyltransferase [Acidobacteriaceae bacterium]|jgi:ribosomal protein S18 acetylase RimI-like enzyme|nr:N-acetyltransferase [Acidobacteriaceae bacterium]
MSCNVTQSTWIVPATPPEVEPISLRPATTDDANLLSLIGGATFLEAFTWMLPGEDILAHCTRNHSPESYRKYLAQPTTSITLAVTGGGAPVGYAMVTAPDLPSFDLLPGDIELKRIYLFSRFRGPETPVLDAAGYPVPGLRVGQALMQSSTRAAISMGCRRLLLGTHENNQRAIAFYRRNGFREVGTRTFQVGSQSCCDLIFGRDLP